MKRYLYFAVFLAFFASCSNNFQQSAKKNESREKDPPNLSRQEAMFYGYDQKNISDSSIIIKIKATNNEDIDSFMSSIEDFNILEIGREAGFVEDEMYVFVKTLGNYPETLEKIRSLQGVIYAEPNYKVKVIEPCNQCVCNEFLKPFGLQEGNISEDPVAEMKGYSLEITDALKAYKDFGYGKHTVWAGIIDSGSNGKHEDMKGSDGNSIVKVMKTYFGGVKENELKELPSGSNSDDEGDGGGHGTHCTGIICALGDNDKGIAGVAWKNVNLISYKGIKNGNGHDISIYGSLRDLVDTIRSRVKEEEQATIPINMSLGGLMVNNYMVEQINYALSKGVLPVVANGNDGQLLASYPAACPGVLAVGASGDNDKKASFSTYGPWLNVVAPGLEIISLSHKTTKDYVYMSGTSMATPFVTGLATYLLSFDPHLSPYQIIAILEMTSDKIDANNTDITGRYDETGFSMWYGHGRVNVYKAVKMVKEDKVPKKGEAYVETVLHINVSSEKPCVYVYEKNTGVLVSMNLPVKKPSGQKGYYVDIRGLRPATYNVLFNQRMQEVTIGNEKDVEITF